MSEQQYAVVDCEATGLDTKKDRIVQIAVILVDEDGNVTEQWKTNVNPEQPLPAESTLCHGLTDEDLKDAPTFPEIADKLTSLLDGRVFVAHNTRYDANLIFEELQRVGRTAAPSKVLCTIKLARKALSGQTSKFNLADLCQVLGIEQLNAHDAEDDALVTTQLLMELLGRTPERPYEEWGNLKIKSSWKVPKIDRVECDYTNPGKLPENGKLIQGMRVVFTGGNEGRDRITRLAQAAGLDAVNKISSTTSVLVTDDPNLGTAKTREAQKMSIRMIDYATMETLLGDVQAGQKKA